MLRMTWRTLLARKLRLALSAFAIVLGVAFVAGSFIFTDAMGRAFDGIIEGSTSDVEVAYRGANDFDSQQDVRTIPASVVHRLERLPQAAAVHGNLQQQSVYVVGHDGKVVGGGGPPGLAFNYTGAKNLLGRPILTLTSGSLPRGDGQVALDVDTARKAGYAVGDRLSLVTPGRPPKVAARLTGLVQFGEGGTNGATLSIFDRAAMQRLFYGGRDVYSSVSLEAADGVSQAQLRDAAQKLLPAGVVARTGDESVKKNKESLDQILGFLNTFLLVFAAISLVVGTFLIVNTFSILVAQRSRELALLRALGASRRQVNASVLLEAVVVGLLGSTVGLGAGYLLAKGLQALFGVFGLDLSRAHFTVHPRTIVAAYAVGVLVTIVAALLPARRASTVPPVAALRDDVAMPESSLRRRLVVGVLMIAAGIGGMVWGFDRNGDTGLLLIGLGMLSILIGVSLLSPWLGRPLVRAFEIAYRRLFGTVGVLASQNAGRNPRRTAATASALMIGLTLVSVASVLADSVKASTDAALEKTLTSQFVVSSVVNAPFSGDIARQIRRVDGVQSVASMRTAFPEVDGRPSFVAAVNPSDLGLALAVPMQQGSLAALRPGTIVVDAQAAKRRHLSIGDRVPVAFQAGTQVLRVVAIFGQTGALPANYLVTQQTLLKGGIAPLDSVVFVTESPGADTAAVRRAVDAITKDLPTVAVQDPAEFAQQQEKNVDLFLYFIYGLLGLAIVIAVLGIVNTLALSVIERTREVGLLRAVGLSRPQLRRMVRLESVVVSVLGAALGVGMGLVFGIALQRAIADQGVDVLAVPWGRLLAFVLLAAVAGVLAAVLPARRAAHLDVLRAIGTE
ncbi:MAG: FtsX-like permease family protein [Nocardioidaceae bacterium]|nr:FtsX-like permease family protein [Nocardioidaceae bacterium]NUS50522.1 FtsX-like permease family protein [Nocardioidaceae bacterium]